MYNLLSDKLDRFEREVRKLRNGLVAKLMTATFTVSRWIFGRFKPYIHTDYLRAFRAMVDQLQTDIDAEVELRKKILGASNQSVA